MSVHHELRQEIEDAIRASGAQVETVVSGRMVVGNLDDIVMHVVAAIGGIEDRLQAAEDEATVADFVREVETWQGS
jgi:hypothetical protein